MAHEAYHHLDAASAWQSKRVPPHRIGSGAGRPLADEELGLAKGPSGGVGHDSGERLCLCAHRHQDRCCRQQGHGKKARAELKASHER